MVTKRGHGEGTIRQRTDGRWEARISLPAGGTKSLYAKTQRDARDRLREAQCALEEGLDLAGRKESVGQLLDRWLAASGETSVKVKTYESADKCH